mgnify:CR=1 FL=1
MDNKATLPRETISRLVEHYLSNKRTNVTPEVTEGITKYLELFIEEAILRSIENHKDSGTEKELHLEYDDLEKIIGLLMMDM